MVKQFYIGGMTCINCQNKIEQRLSQVDGIQEVSVSYNTGIARLTFDSGIISFFEICQLIEDLDYEVLTKDQRERTKIGRIVFLLGIILVLYRLLQKSGLLNMLVPSQLATSGMSYGMLFVVGLVTSVHCIAMCGGINLSQCISQTKSKEEDAGLRVFLPALLYNLGRVISYTVVGFLLGLFGMMLGGKSGTGISAMTQGILKLVAGLFMVIMGLNMLNLFPWLRKFNLRLPNFLAKKINRKKGASRQPLFIGLLNGLMPCGPLQSMQIIALASGNPITGAISMFLFSLGTVPLMLGLGSMVSLLGKRFAKSVMNVGAVLVVVLGLAMLSQGGILSGMLLPDQLLFLIIGLSILGIVASIPYPRKYYRMVSVAATFIVVFAVGIAWQSLKPKMVSGGAEAQVMDGVQIVSSTLSSGNYPSITVQAGIPVRWMIDAPEGSINGCNYKMIIQEYGIEYSFEKGMNVIEFTPGDAGIVEYSCWMGMIRGSIYVTEADSGS